MVVTLRGRLKEHKILCYPWHKYRGEIREFCISAKCLFSNSGIPHDVLEIELREEGWLEPGEKLMEVLRTDSNLRRPWLPKLAEGLPVDSWTIPDDWTEADYAANFA